MVDESTPEIDYLGVGAGDGDQPQLPADYTLDQNYPNPFNPSTQIRFSLPSAAHVTLSVYNIIGQRLEVLVDEELEAGDYSVSWDGSERASGVYFYTIDADNFRATRPMVLQK
jgi:hypothetical protein